MLLLQRSAGGLKPSRTSRLLFSSGYIALLKESSSPPGLKFCGSGSVSSWDFETQRDTEVNKSNIFHISALTHCTQSSLQSGKHEDKYPVRSESNKLANERYLKCYHKHKTTTWAAQYLLSSSRLIIRSVYFLFLLWNQADSSDVPPGERSHVSPVKPTATSRVPTTYVIVIWIHSRASDILLADFTDNQLK